MIGDVYGSMGRDMLYANLAELRLQKKINFTIVNGENIAHGSGINEHYYKELLENNVNVVTLGNHAFRNNDIYNFINNATKSVRPLNLPNGVPGQGYVTVRYKNITITVFQVLGRTFINGPLECAFQKTEELLAEVKSDIYICDFHGEATSEKIAFGLWFDGRVNVIAGTHTHIQTNDAHILDKGTMYITDLGMTGARDGIIGVDPQMIEKKFILGLPCRHLPMEKGKKQLCGLIIEINEQTHKVTNFEVINMIQ